MEKEFSIEYSLKWGAYVSRVIRIITLATFIIWFTLMFNIDGSRKAILEVIFAIGIFLGMLFLGFYDLFRKEKISLNKGILEIETSKLSGNSKIRFNTEEIFEMGIITKEYMWNKIYGRENPSYVRYKMSFRYREKEIFFADGLDHKSAFYVLSKMKENSILAEKLK